MKDEQIIKALNDYYNRDCHLSKVSEDRIYFSINLAHEFFNSFNMGFTRGQIIDVSQFSGYTKIYMTVNINELELKTAS